jgi:ketosteroid isomerase-like protein
VISAASAAPRFFDGTVAAMSDVVERFLNSLETRDFETLADCFAPDAKLRALLPSRIREEDGRDAIQARYRFWLGKLGDYELLRTASDSVVDRALVRYRVRGVDPEDGLSEMEQHGYATVEDGRITALNVVCSGFRPLA